LAMVVYLPFIFLIVVGLAARYQMVSKVYIQVQCHYHNTNILTCSLDAPTYSTDIDTVTDTSDDAESACWIEPVDEEIFSVQIKTITGSFSTKLKVYKPSINNTPQVNVVLLRPSNKPINTSY